jgi:SAM-dependent methyltransferase
VANRHPWERARASFFTRLLRRTLGNRKPVRCLDVGCGDGWFARQLHPRLASGSSITGWDVALSEERIREQSVNLPEAVRFTRSAPQGGFDLILCMDVCEHVEDDVAFLHQIVNEYLVPGGLLLCSVPAWPELYSHHDVALHHYRRYRPEVAAERLRGSGLNLVRQGGLFHCLLPVRSLQMMLWRRREALGLPIDTGAGSWQGSSIWTGFLTAVLGAEGYLSWLASALNLNLPGLSWWSLCEKP